MSESVGFSGYERDKAVSLLIFLNGLLSGFLVVVFVEDFVGYGDGYGAAGSGAFSYDGYGDLGVSHCGISYEPGMGSDIPVGAVVFG
mgnify:CR=1 FL=1